MQDLISRQAAIDAIEHRLAEPAYQHTGEDWYVGMNCAESELYELPSAQPEIIRCKDCKHKHVENMVWTCPFGLPGGENFFCGYGTLLPDNFHNFDFTIKQLIFHIDLHRLSL